MKATFLVPLYDTRDHFARGVELVNSYQKLSPSEDIALIFSFQEHLDKFMGMLENKSNVLPLLLPEVWLTPVNQIIVKKMVGSKTLFDNYGYDFVAVVDAESLFIKPVNTLELCKEIWKQPLIGNLPSGTASGILKGTVDFSGISQEDIDKYQLGQYYFWFNEIPVYEKKTFRLFWKWLFERENYNPMPLFDQPSVVDYTLYGFFLIINEIKKPNLIQIRSNLYGLLEEFPSRGDIDRDLVLEQMGTHWCKCPLDYLTWLENKPKIKMLFNMDRDDFGEAHDYSWGYWK